jgi:hypothetical protein
VLDDLAALISDGVADPISGFLPSRAYLCEIRRAGSP